MEISFNVIAGFCGAIVMFWALFSQNGLNDNASGDSSLLGLLIALPIAIAIIVGLVFIVPILLGILAVALIVGAVGAAVYGLWKLLTSGKARSAMQRTRQRTGSALRSGFRVVGTLLKKLRNGFRAAGGKALGLLRKILTALRRLTAKMVRMLRPFAAKLFRAARKTASAVLGKIRQLFRPVIRALKRMVRSTLRTLKATVKTVLHFLRPALRALRKTAGSLLKTLHRFLRPVSRTLHRLLHFVRKLLQPVLRVVRRLLTRSMRLLRNVLRPVFRLLHPILQTSAHVLRKVLRIPGRLISRSPRLLRLTLKLLHLAGLLLPARRRDDDRDDSESEERKKEHAAGEQTHPRGAAREQTVGSQSADHSHLQQNTAAVRDSVQNAENDRQPAAQHVAPVASAHTTGQPQSNTVPPASQSTKRKGGHRPFRRLLGKVAMWKRPGKQAESREERPVPPTRTEQELPKTLPLTQVLREESGAEPFSFSMEEVAGVIEETRHEKELIAV